MKDESSGDVSPPSVSPPGEYQEAEAEGEESQVKPVPKTMGESSTAVFDSGDRDLVIGQREEPASVKNRLVWSVVLFVVGVALVVLGFVSESASPTPGGGVPFWVIGVMLIIPGIYCAWDSVITLRQQEKTDRQKILGEEEANPQ